MYNLITVEGHIIDFILLHGRQRVILGLFCLSENKDFFEINFVISKLSDLNQICVKIEVIICLCKIEALFCFEEQLQIKFKTYQLHNLSPLQLVVHTPGTIEFEREITFYKGYILLRNS